MAHAARPRIPGRIPLCLLLAGVLLAACADEGREYPLREEGRDLGSLSGAVGSAPPVAAAVTFDRILRARAEPQNWLTYYGAYDGQRYSSLDQINTRNVRNLRPAWTFQFGQFESCWVSWRLHRLERKMEPCQTSTPPRGGTRPSCVSEPCGWSTSRVASASA